MTTVILQGSALGAAAEALLREEAWAGYGSCAQQAMLSGAIRFGSGVGGQPSPPTLFPFSHTSPASGRPSRFRRVQLPLAA